MHPRLGDGHGLLLHRLVDCHAIVLPHLVELINAHEAAVGEDHRPGLEAALPRLGVGRDGRRESNAGGALAGGAHSEGSDAHGAAQELGLGRGGVANHENVDVPAEVGAVGEVLLAAREELQGEGLLDDVMAVDGGTDAAPQDVEDIGTLPQGADGAHVVRGEDEAVRVPAKDPHVVGKDGRGEHPRRAPLPGRCCRQGAIHAHDLNAIPRLDLVHQVVIEYQVHRPRELSHGSSLRHLLQRDGLVVLVHAQPELRLQRVSLLILRWVAAGRQLHHLIGQLPSRRVDLRQPQLGIGGVDVAPRLVRPRRRAVVDALYDLGLHAAHLHGHPLDADETPEAGGAQLARTDGPGTDGTPQRHPHPHVVLVVPRALLQRDVVSRRLQGANVSQRIAKEGVREAGIVGAQVREGDAEAGVADEGAPDASRGVRGGALATAPAAGTPPDVIIDGGADALGVGESLLTEEVVVLGSELEEGVGHG
mmetsp:Transcript_483/g.1110  ORF Transcript_483/g.1110 Transcript_483/m.1110 type:complete len:478 (+) Transcript_483:1188-2621(+)